jgi:type II secretory pathway pseudopilin PulG
MGLWRCKPVGTKQGGFAYLLLLIAVVVIGIAAGGSLSIGAQTTRRDAEQQLLAVGREFQQALRSYAGLSQNALAGVGARGPRTLEELLKDPRSPDTRRHLRQLYADPLTGQVEWGLLNDPTGFILGVYSLAPGRPIKQTGFVPAMVGFEDADSYGAWVFGLPMAGPAQTPK